MIELKLIKNRLLTKSVLIEKAPFEMEIQSLIFEDYYYAVHVRSCVNWQEINHLIAKSSDYKHFSEYYFITSNTSVRKTILKKDCRKIRHE